LSTESIDFIREFLDAEYAAMVAVATERDNAILQRGIHHANSFFAEGLDSKIFRSEDADEEFFADMADQLEDDAPRKLFLVRSYAEPSFGVVHRCYASTTRIKGTTYFNTLFVAPTDEGLKIVSRYTIDRGHTAWEHSGGARFSQAGKQTAVIRLKPPTDARDLADYESDEALIR
jgi:hypothetical protein